MLKASGKGFVLLAGLAVGAVLAFVPAASAAVAPGSLHCPTLSPYNSAHYGLEVGATVTCTIEGATDVADGPVDVFIKSTALGNTTVAGVALGGVITFSFTAPANGCDTSVVAYGTNGNVSNNDFIDDGLQNGSGTNAAGFAYLNAQGQNPACNPTAVVFRGLAAERTGAGVVVRWRTGSEVGTVGFNVYRQVAGQRVKLNRSLVRARSGLAGHGYSFLDRRGTRGSRYWVQAVERNGARAWQGPAAAH